LPPEGDIHMIETISPEASISIHVLGNDIGCVQRQRYDVEHQQVHRFTSGYVNTACTTYRLAHQHLVVADVSQTAGFYERVFGATRIEETQVNDVPLIRLDLHGTPLLISGAFVPGLQTHYGLVAADFAAALNELKQRGVHFLSEPLQVGGQQMVVVTDPNGQQVSILTNEQP
jgi:predicted enzyme related to lactoylglutathione lyase